MVTNIDVNCLTIHKCGYDLGDELREPRFVVNDNQPFSSKNCFFNSNSIHMVAPVSYAKILPKKSPYAVFRIVAIFLKFQPMTRHILTNWMIVFQSDMLPWKFQLKRMLLSRDIKFSNNNPLQKERKIKSSNNMLRNRYELY